ncbi:hypothetical protein TELCIR_09008 [Teladorsagia circumcincta]|uniref:Abnormal cell migration protein 18-like fibronectin type I domain-containing protein n=1 Tax=Teladorsagia circumcincta TaxID=45464 RepID=A0A2G9UG92_TELCI|nr:hypothetical protein TELCIR_09008 [Teladorsagia circumcincta]
MRFLVVLALFAGTMACLYKNEKYKDGDTWVSYHFGLLLLDIVVRSTFIMKCKINKDGSWSTKVMGCRTTNGIVVEPGRTISEGDTTYECTAKRDGRVEIKRSYQLSKKQISCEGHAIGEMWVSQHNFHKTCTESGARITECLTDAGIAVPINQHLVLSGIKYTYVTHLALLISQCL